jgi:hypothetical protein
MCSRHIVAGIIQSVYPTMDTIDIPPVIASGVCLAGFVDFIALGHMVCSKTMHVKLDILHNLVACLVRML